MPEPPSSSSAAIVFSATDAAFAVTGGSVGCNNTVNVTNYLGPTSSEVEEIASWLSIEQHRVRHDEHHMRRAKGTLEGFLKSDVYTAWVKGEGAQSLHLECRGMPGAGKSTVASAVVEDLQDRLSSTSDVVVYAYFRYDSQENQTPELVIPHLLGQAVRRCGEVSAEVRALYKEYRTTVPRMDKATDAFRLTVSGRSLYVVLDALDEYSVKDYDKAVSLINALQPLEAKLLVTSRHSVPFPTNTFCTYEVRADPNDVRMLIMEHIKNYHRLDAFTKDSPELLEEIITKISEQTSGMFIIVRLLLELLSSQLTPHGVRKELKHLPADLEKTYESAMERIHQQSPEVVRIADESFAWVFYAIKPLSAQQLQHAVSFNTIEHLIGSEYLIPIGDILTACCGLIIVVDDKCQFVHFSTKEFFQKPEILQKYLPGAERKITEKCLCYATAAATHLAELNSDEAIQTKISDMKLCTYATTYWGSHASRVLADFNQLEQMVEDLVKQTLWPKMVDRWEPGICGASKLPSQHCLILYLAQYGRIKLLQVHWNRNAVAAAAAISQGRTPDNPNLARDGNGWAAIHFATSHDHENIVQFLIERGGVEANLSINDGKTPLHIAARLARDSIALTLLGKGADPNARDGNGGTPLHDAINNGHLSVAIILLNNGARPDIAWKYGTTLLHVAAREGHESIALIVLSKSANSNAEDDSGHTPLRKAIDNGHLLLASLLLDNGACPDIADDWGTTLLHVAASKGYDSFALDLLGRGVDPNARDGYGDTPLSFAIKYGHVSLVSILFNNGARLDTANKRGRTLLHVAAREGRASIALALLGMGLDPNAQDTVGNTPLQKALNNSHLSVITILLANGACPDIANNYGTTLLHVAAKKGYDSIALTLLGKGLDPNAQDRNGDTPLHLAIDNGHLLLITMLLDNDARPNIANKVGTTLLHVAAGKGYDSIALTFLDKGADPNAQDDRGDTPLQKAIDNGHLLLATMLLNNGARPDIANIHGITLLHVAAREGYDSVALTLLGLGLDPNTQDYSGGTPLHLAMANDHISLVEMLLNNGADVQRQNKCGQTALHYATTQRLPPFSAIFSSYAYPMRNRRAPLDRAAWTGRMKMVSLLVERGADLLVIDNDGKTALDHVFIGQHPDTVNLMVVALIKRYRPLASKSLTVNQGDQVPDNQFPLKDISPKSVSETPLRIQRVFVLFLLSLLILCVVILWVR